MRLNEPRIGRENATEELAQPLRAAPQRLRLAHSARRPLPPSSPATAAGKHLSRLLLFFSSLTARNLPTISLPSPCNSLLRVSQL